MANPYYSRTYTFATGTKAKGEQVKFEFDNLVSGLDVLDIDLPTRIGDGTGFSQTVVVSDATADDHASSYGQMVAYVNLIVAGEATPALIPITDLAVGTLADGEVVQRSGAGLVGLNVENHVLAQAQATALSF